MCKCRVCLRVCVSVCGVPLLLLLNADVACCCDMMKTSIIRKVIAILSPSLYGNNGTKKRREF